MTILGLPYLQIGTIPCKAAKFRGHTPGLPPVPVLWYCPAPPAIRLVSPHSRLFVIITNLAFIFCYDLRKQVYDLLTRSCRPLYTEIPVCLWSSCTRGGTNFAAARLFTSSVKCVGMLSTVRQESNVTNVANHTPSVLKDDSLTPFPTFSLVKLKDWRPES